MLIPRISRSRSRQRGQLDHEVYVHQRKECVPVTTRIVLFNACIHYTHALAAALMKKEDISQHPHTQYNACMAIRDEQQTYEEARKREVEASGQKNAANLGNERNDEKDDRQMSHHLRPARKMY
ncbi:uncharacterized protein EI90DRAFT_3042438 [Cantharellus anzutake]|uniref:uncharacterized protein n=1 Tax=Cantharellus anzutake TaxID=1750568 RepID=UPI001907305A|nr:uncharacterized protein EI90DRAFT_3042438 [Cantharellus anzutake]KAF8338305.1 hypothetical protein EI90DRAFT_3042438 [Cantharellus anzutake]